ncbi:MAG: isoleucine--tRNA ligase [Elusimicrobia bacterium]|nr:isoleucine--tRNA ligase [Elusimicrobiota bacterium]
MNYNDTLNLPRTDFSMKANLREREPRIQALWKDIDVYGKIMLKNREGEVFILHDGPPYANGHIHMGHALNRILKDIVIKYKALSGFSIPFVPGWDCHGLPVEYELIKKLGSGQTKNKTAFRKKAAEYAMKFVDIQKNEFKRLGLLGYWEDPYLTLSPEYEEKIIDSFKRLYLGGFIYRELKPVYWCPSCTTALAEAEVEYSDISSPSVYVRFKMLSCVPRFVAEDETVDALVWTTTPWTLPSNVALCFHPDYEYAFIKKGKEYLIVADKFAAAYEGYRKKGSVRGKDLEGCEFEAPFGGRRSKGINGEFVTLEDGTGIVHIAPGHGEDDYFIGKKYDLPVLSPVNEKGQFTADAGLDELTGRGVFESDARIKEILAEKGLLFKSEELSHSYPHCWRCKKAVIFRATKQWFMSVDKDGLRKTILEKIPQVSWYPEVSVKRITAMIQNRPDWCLSRQRLWGVPIPVFYCSECGDYLATEESFEKVKKMIRDNGSDSWFEREASDILGDGIRCGCGSTRFVKEEDILDVWFDSGVSHFAVLKTRKNLRWPADMYLEGSDQHRGWFQTSIIPAVAIDKTPPYRNVLTHGFIVDAEGKKMSKSLGNVISPQEVIEKHGADILRYLSASENYFKDIKISEEILSHVVVNYRRIRNTIRFILGNLNGFRKENAVAYADMTPIDKYVLHKFHNTLKAAMDNYDNYLFFRSIREIHDFCNNVLSSFYFNILKDRLYVSARYSHERCSSQTVLKIIGENLLAVISPILSHTAEEGWQAFKKEHDRGGVYPESVFLGGMPALTGEWFNEEIEKEIDRVVELRNIVLKCIEEAKAAGVIKDPLESSVTIDTSSGEIYDFLNSLGKSLKEYLIVSSVTLEKKAASAPAREYMGGEISVTVGKAPGSKCVRCWLVDETVGSDEEHPGLCGRCSDVVKK